MSTIWYSLVSVSLGENIKRLRWASGLQTQKAFADRLGVPQPRVSDWENDRYDVLETTTLVRIAKGLRCSIDDLLVGLDPDYDRIRRTGRAPAVGPAGIHSPVDARADIPVVVEGDAMPEVITQGGRTVERSGIVQWVPRPRDLADPNAYGIRIRGDSMIPAHRPKTIAIMAPARRVQDGDEVYVQLGSGERLIRQVRTIRGGCLLQSYNHAYQPLLLHRKDIRAMDVVVSSRLPVF